MSFDNSGLRIESGSRSIGRCRSFSDLLIVLTLNDMKYFFLAVVVVVVSVLTPHALAAQSLAEVARVEKSRREALAKQAAEGVPPRVFTNKDLRSTGWLTAREGMTAPSLGLATPSLDDLDAEGVSEEEQWRGRMMAARQSFERAQLHAEALQNRIDGLWAEFTARDDPAQQAILAQDRQTALDELAQIRMDIDDWSQQIAEIRDEARRARVPPGWLR